MKKLYIIFALGLLTVFGCDKADELLTFEIKHSSSVTVENNVVPFDPPMSMPTPPVTTNSEQKFSSNNTSKDKVKDIKLKELTLTITDPPSKTFSFLKEIYIYISTNSNNEMQIASKTDIPKDAQSIELKTTDKNLDEYVKAEEFDLRTEVVTRELISDDVTIDMDMVFEVTADPL